jgi:hypothetical protein
MARPQTAQSLLGRNCLFPLNWRFSFDISAVQGNRHPWIHAGLEEAIPSASVAIIRALRWAFFRAFILRSSAVLP